MDKPTSLHDFQQMFYNIYWEKDVRDYSASDILLHVNEQASKTSKALRKGNQVQVVKSLPFLFCWILSFCNRMNISLEEAVFNKYQNICPYCGTTKNCMCITTETKPKEWIKNPNGKMPESIAEWQDMFKRIYGNINTMLWHLQIWLHVHEELGEASEEFRLKNSLKMEEELADSFAWLMAFCNRLEIDLAEITWETYPGTCSHCHEEKCACGLV